MNEDTEMMMDESNQPSSQPPLPSSSPSSLTSHQTEWRDHRPVTLAPESSACEADPMMNKFLGRYQQPCPEHLLPYVLREYFHSSIMTSLGLQPYFTIPTINVIFSYLWTGPAVFGSRGFKFMRHWEKRGDRLPFSRYFPYGVNHDEAYLISNNDSLKLIGESIYHSLEMIGHLHVDHPINKSRFESNDADDTDGICTDPITCAWAHFKNMSMDEIRLEDYHQMAIEDAPPPEFTDHQTLRPIHSFDPFARIWHFDSCTPHAQYMNVEGTQLVMKENSDINRSELFRELACAKHGVYGYDGLEQEVITRTRLIKKKGVALTTEEYESRRIQLEATQATEQKLTKTHADTLMLFQLSIVHQRADDQTEPVVPARSLGQTQIQYCNKYDVTWMDEIFKRLHSDAILEPRLESIYHAYSDQQITYSIRMKPIAGDDYSTRTLYIGWSTLRFDTLSSRPLWETEFLRLPPAKLSTAALVKVQIQCQRHSDRMTQTVILTRLNHPSSEVYRATLPDIPLGLVDSDIPHPLITCQLKEIACPSNSSSSASFSQRSDVTSSTVYRFLVIWLVDGVEVTQQPLSISCYIPKSQTAFIDEVCHPILFTSLGVKYELCQQMGPNPYWQPGYFPIDFDQAKLLTQNEEQRDYTRVDLSNQLI